MKAAATSAALAALLAAGCAASSHAAAPDAAECARFNAIDARISLATPAQLDGWIKSLSRITATVKGSAATRSPTKAISLATIELGDVALDEETGQQAAADWKAAASDLKDAGRACS